VPFYQRTHTTYDVLPASQAVVVTPGAGGAAAAPAPFEVMGFSVSGRVVDRAGQPVGAGVTVAVDGVVRATTDAHGSYKLDQIRSGSSFASITASHPHTFFRALKHVTVTPATTALPDLVVTSYHVCGVVNSGEPTPTRVVTLATANGQTLTTYVCICMRAANADAAAPCPLPSALCPALCPAAAACMRCEVVAGGDDRFDARRSAPRRCVCVAALATPISCCLPPCPLSLPFHTSSHCCSLCYPFAPPLAALILLCGCVG
jgi:hypothetical protein